MKIQVAIMKVFRFLIQGYFNENNKDRTGEFYNALAQKKYMQTYEKGKLVSQSEIIEGVQVNE